MSAARQKVPAVPISDPLAFNPFDAAEGWTPIPHRFFDLLAEDEDGNTKVMSLGQVRWLLSLAREKWRGLKRGQTPKDTFSDPHSIAWIAKDVGVVKSQAQGIVADALERGLVKRVRRQGEREWRYRLAIENWAAAKFYEPSYPQRDETADDKPVEIAETGGEEKESDRTGLPVSSCPSERIPAGRVKVLEIAQTGQKLRANNKLDVDIDVVAHHVADGLLEIEFSPPIERPAQVVEISAGDPLPRRRAAAVVPTPPAAAPFPDLYAFLLPRFNATHNALDTDTLSRIGKAVGGHLEDYKDLVKTREQKKGSVPAGAYVGIAQKELPAFLAQRSEVHAKGLKAPAKPAAQSRATDWDAVNKILANRNKGGPGDRRK